MVTTSVPTSDLIRCAVSLSAAASPVAGKAVG